jgi:hypothetical protein
VGRLPPIGFWSYARGDDDASRGRLSALRTLLRTELQAQYGRDPVQIFQDVAAIPPGSEWETEIRRALGQATFFIPIITPQFIQSEWCCKEVTIFLDRERSIWREHPELAGVRRIFPIHYRDIHEIDPFDPTIVTEIRRLQWVDFRGLRRKAEDDEALTGSIDRLAESVCRLLRAHLSAADAPRAEPMAPEEPKRPTASPGSHDVYLCYASHDKAAADAICAQLERDGVRCWIAPRDILPQQEWSQSIISALSAAKVFVLVFSSSANESSAVRREVERAVHDGLPIVPFRIADVAPSGSLQFFISTRHWLDGFEGSFDQRLSDLSRVVKRMLAEPGSR